MKNSEIEITKNIKKGEYHVNRIIRAQVTPGVVEGQGLEGWDELGNRVTKCYPHIFETRAELMTFFGGARGSVNDADSEIASAEESGGILALTLKGENVGDADIHVARALDPETTPAPKREPEENKPSRIEIELRAELEAERKERQALSDRLSDLCAKLGVESRDPAAAANNNSRDGKGGGKK